MVGKFGQNFCNVWNPKEIRVHLRSFAVPTFSVFLRFLWFDFPFRLRLDSSAGRGAFANHPY